MAYPKRYVEHIITGLEDPLNQHLVKLIGFDFAPELREHFRQECEAWLDKIQRLRMKPNNRTGPAKFYYDLLYDYPFGGVEIQNMRSVMDFITRRYPGVRATKKRRRSWSIWLPGVSIRPSPSGFTLGSPSWI